MNTRKGRESARHGDKVNPEVLDQRVDAALKAALKGATGNQRRRTKSVSSSEDDSDDNDGGCSWSGDGSNEEGREHQQHQEPTDQSRPPLTPEGTQTTKSDDELDDSRNDDEHHGPAAKDNITNYVTAKVPSMVRRCNRCGIDGTQVGARLRKCIRCAKRGIEVPYCVSIKSSRRCRTRNALIGKHRVKSVKKPTGRFMNSFAVLPTQSR